MTVTGTLTVDGAEPAEPATLAELLAAKHPTETAGQHLTRVPVAHAIAGVLVR